MEVKPAPSRTGGGARKGQPNRTSTMQTNLTGQAATGYRTGARLLHWLMAVLVLMMLAAGFLMLQEWLSRETRNGLFIFHKNVGVLMLVLIAVRLLYRWANRPVLEPVDMPRWQQMAAHGTHLALYALLIIMPLAGYIRVKAGGFPIEGLDAMGVPSLVPRSDALAAAAKQVHYLGAFALAGVVAMHIGAAAFHAIVKRDGVFSRMWPPVAQKTGAA
jgi:cytochrome b561